MPASLLEQNGVSQCESDDDGTLTEEQVRQLIQAAKHKCLAEVEGVFKELESLFME